MTVREMPLPLPCNDSTTSPCGCLFPLFPRSITLLLGERFGNTGAWLKLVESLLFLLVIGASTIAECRTLWIASLKYLSYPSALRLLLLLLWNVTLRSRSSLFSSCGTSDSSRFLLGNDGMCGHVSALSDFPSLRFCGLCSRRAPLLPSDVEKA